MKRPYYVGLDLSLTGTGVCVTNGEEVETRVIRCGDKRGPERLQHINKEIALLIYGTELGASPKLVAIEGYAFGAHSGQLASLGELGGTVKHCIYGASIDFIIVPPTVLKKFITGKGNAEKRQIGVALYKFWGREFDDDNQADAFALAQLAMAYDGKSIGKDLTKDQQAILGGIRKDPWCLAGKKRKAKEAA